MAWLSISKGEREERIAEQKSGQNQGEGKSEYVQRTGGGGRKLACWMMAVDIVHNGTG